MSLKAKSLQQVNLYQDELKEIKLKYSFEILLKLSVAIVIVLSLVGGFKYYQLKYEEINLAETKKRSNALKTEKQKIEKSKGKKDAALAAKITEKTRELANKQKVVQVLSQDEFGNANGFSGYLGGLARQRLEGLWLTHLSLSGGGSNIVLNGSTLKAELLPKYLQRLSSETAFSGITFQKFVMGRDDSKKRRLNFTLQSMAQKRPLEK